MQYLHRWRSYVFRGIDRTSPRSLTIPTATLLAEPSIPKQYIMSRYDCIRSVYSITSRYVHVLGEYFCIQQMMRAFAEIWNRDWENLKFIKRPRARSVKQARPALLTYPLPPSSPTPIGKSYLSPTVAEKYQKESTWRRVSSSYIRSVDIYHVLFLF